MSISWTTVLNTCVLYHGDNNKLVVLIQQQWYGFVEFLYVHTCLTPLYSHLHYLNCIRPPFTEPQAPPALTTSLQAPQNPKQVCVKIKVFRFNGWLIFCNRWCAIPQGHALPYFTYVDLVYLRVVTSSYLCPLVFSHHYRFSAAALMVNFLPQLVVVTLDHAVGQQTSLPLQL